MKQLIRIILMCIMVLFSWVSTAAAKGPADMITISGPGLGELIEVTDPKVLEPFSPWGDGFYDRQAGTPPELPRSDRLYQVLFYVKDEAGVLRVRYGFQYAPGHPGFIHLPGKGDEWYETNIGTISNRGLDGQWLYASQEWDDLIGHLLEEREESMTGNTQPSDDIAKTAGAVNEQKTFFSSAAQTINVRMYSPILWLGIGLAAVLAVIFLRRALTKIYR